MYGTFGDWFNTEFIPNLEKLMKKTIGVFTQPLRLAFVNPTKGPHIVYSKYSK